MAQCQLGEFYFDGNGIKQDKAEGLKLIRASAEQGFAWAQYRLGKCYLEGNGVEQDKTEAVKWIRKAAEQDESEPQLLLGWIYETSDGVEQDKVEAAKWYTRAADHRNENALESLKRLGVEYHYLPEREREWREKLRRQRPQNSL